MVASMAMRHLLVDYARARKADKRGGQRVRVDIENADPSETAAFVDILEVDDLLTQLAAADERLAKVVELRFFGGLTNTEIGNVLGVHERTVKRDWQVARAWLYSRLRRDGHDVSRGLGAN
jgi:RNA polymerase sigma factor (TIGR02999 family)